MRFLLPKGFNDDFKVKLSELAKDSGYYSDYFNFIFTEKKKRAGGGLSNLEKVMRILSVLSEEKDDKFVILHSRKLKKLVSFHSKKTSTYSPQNHLKVLSELGFVEINKKYSSGRYSKSYRLKPDLRKDLEVVGDLDVPKKKRATRSRGEQHPRSEQQSNADPLNSYIHSILLDLTPPDDLETIISDFRKEKEFKKMRRLESILARKIKMPKRCRYGRLHHTLTNIPKTVRKRFLFSGRGRIAEIDQNASQPFFLLNLYDGSNSDHLKEKNRYYELFKSDFYSELIKGAEISGERDPIKTRFFEYLMGMAFERRKRPVKIFQSFHTYFESNFPILTALILKKKTLREDPCLHEDEIYKQMAHFLQRTESSIWIDRICVRLMEMGRLFVPIHDCLVVPEAEVEETKRIIFEEFEQAGFLKPGLKVKVQLH